ncbi:MAG: ABC transporter permease [Rhodospirillales bacterium]|nr:ABC transporter permease [Rhodospirillales bacterium]
MTRWLALPGVPPLLALLALLGLWHLAATFFGYNFFPTPGAVFKTLPALFGEAEAAANIAASVKRMLAGFALALAVAVPLGLMMGRSPLVAKLVKPLVATIYPVPKAALMPIIMLWLGIGDAAKIFVIFIGASLPLLQHSFGGALAVDQKLIWSAQAMGLGPVKRLFAVVLPSALPEVMIGCRVGIIMALIVMVSSEMIARQSGVGNLLFNSADMALYDTVYAMIVVIAAIGFVADVAFEFVRRRLTFWAEIHQDPLVPSA